MTATPATPAFDHETLIDHEGSWTGNVDFGDLTMGDRWADLANASTSLDWSFGPGHQDELFELYRIEPDEQRIDYYRPALATGVLR